MPVNRARTQRRAEVPYDVGPPSSRVVTPAGPLDVKATQRDHLYVTGARSYHNVPVSDGEAFRIRGVEYIVSAHVYRWRDGSWHIGTERRDDTPQAGGDFHASRFHSLSMTRPDYKDTSEPARATARSLIEDAASAWALHNPRTLDRAEVAQRTNELRNAVDEFNRKAEELDALTDKVYEREIAYQHALEAMSVWTDADNASDEDLEAAGAMFDRLTK